MQNSGLALHWTRPKWVLGLEGVEVFLGGIQAAFLGASGSLMLPRPSGRCFVTFVLRAFRDRPTRRYLVNIPRGRIRKIELNYSRMWGKLGVRVDPAR